MKCIRTCIACRKKDDKSNLIRIVACLETGEAKIDASQKQNARGIYICNNPECINKLLKMKNINKVVKNGIEVGSLKRLLVEMEDM